MSRVSGNSDTTVFGCLAAQLPSAQSEDSVLA